MIHLGDITQINGYDAPVVDVVIGGSPCMATGQANAEIMRGGVRH